MRHAPEQGSSGDAPADERLQWMFNDGREVPHLDRQPHEDGSVSPRSAAETQGLTASSVDALMSMANQMGLNNSRKRKINAEQLFEQQQLFQLAKQMALQLQQQQQQQQQQKQHQQQHHQQGAACDGRDNMMTPPALIRLSTPTSPPQSVHGSPSVPNSTGAPSTPGDHLCEHPGCDRVVGNAGLVCIRHAAGRRCDMPGCFKSAQGRTTRCKAHGGGRRCSVAGCSKSAQGSTDLCKAHGGGKRCKLPGCTKAARGSTDYCIAHGGGRRCAKENCDKSAVGSTNFCVKHGGGRRCTVGGCGKSARGGSPFCAKHGTQHRKLLAASTMAHQQQPQQQMQMQHAPVMTSRLPVASAPSNPIIRPTPSRAVQTAPEARAVNPAPSPSTSSPSHPLFAASNTKSSKPLMLNSSFVSMNLLQQQQQRRQEQEEKEEENKRFEEEQRRREQQEQRIRDILLMNLQSGSLRSMDRFASQEREQPSRSSSVPSLPTAQPAYIHQQRFNVQSQSNSPQPQQQQQQPINAQAILDALRARASAPGTPPLQQPQHSQNHGLADFAALQEQLAKLQAIQQFQSQEQYRAKSPKLSEYMSHRQPHH
ncbi:Zinc finger protein 143 [Hondaea fermentalgiana]|uniref:Zinc finger protein 143 n=1 Tax=Hondaea fermentalgiana TaxID=2315210 RepID=A0A2R5GK92_9STRA|nr:Zinc finger protein 143 [Hondaea fermentalgiana]|eukprot:GBG31297.1 Zinc finger protein 143 [Hondaea fermentalgiana]